jgi:hypothetical protein
MILSLDDHNQLYDHEVKWKITKVYISLYWTTQSVMNSARSNFVLKLSILNFTSLYFPFWSNKVHMS